MWISRQKAQAATELAVFGAILMFVVGTIIQSSFNSGMAQNQQLKAMRWALLQSLYGVYNVNKSRVNASVIVVEDRLNPQAGKFGSLERTPFVAAGSGTMSNNIFLPTDWDELQNIPVNDVFINGLHFAFSTARFVIYDVQLVTKTDSYGDFAQHPNEVRVWNLANNTKRFLKKKGNWDDNCKSKEASTDPATCALTNVEDTVGCPLFYRITPSNSDKFCNKLSCIDDTLSLDQRFDLNRNGNFTDDPDVGEERETVLWQWLGIKGIQSIKGLRIDTEFGIYPVWDIDGDRKEETVYRINASIKASQASQWVVNPVPPIVNKTIAQRTGVLDAQEGDMDLTADTLDKTGPDAAKYSKVGLQSAASIYTFTNEGTYLEIKEGKAYVPGTDNFVRSVNKKDQLDIVAREFVLSNNTHRYCCAEGGNCSGFGANGAYTIIGNVKKGLPNPVKYCVATRDLCYKLATASETCYDLSTNTILIRSRIEETRGRKWMTQVK